MNNRDFQITARSFAIPVSMAEFTSIDHQEREWDKDNVCQMLEELEGVYDVDFNGHFGLAIFLTITKESDNDQTLHAISEIINREGNRTWYEIWGNDTSATLTTSDKVQKLKVDGLIEEDAKLIHEFYADNYKDACVIYNKTLREWRE